MEGIGALVFLGALYFIPALIAASRSHNNVWAIFLLNLLLGWTVIGWVGALIWAVANPARPSPNG